MLAASDFLKTEVWTRGGLIIYYILFVIELSSRRARIARLKPHPDEVFMAQAARALTDCEDEFLAGERILLRDRDKKYTEQFYSILSDAGIEASGGRIHSPLPHGKKPSVVE